MFKLEPCDVLLFRVEGDGILERLEREFVGGFSHAALYLGEALRDYFIFESNMRGASMVSLKSEKGRLVEVMRPEISFAQKKLVISKAIELASEETSFYDYPVIFLSCIPRVLKMKFPFLPIPVKYCRDMLVMCAEGVAECYWRAFIPILPTNVVPLPVDFRTSPILKSVYEGRIMEDIVA